MGSVLQQLNDELAGVLAEVQRSLVAVMVDGRGGGSGTIWHPDGLIVTNAHVVGQGGGVRVALQDGRVFPARVLATDPERDLAALMIEANGLPTVQPGSTKSLHPGAWVMAMGHPWGVANAATGGVVIEVGKRLPEMGATTNDWVVISAQLRPGHSGGPLVDVNGRLVGINTLMTGYEVGAAVSVDAVKAFLKRTLGTPAPSTDVV